MANVSKLFSIPDAESSDDTPCVARKFLNEVKDTLVTLQRVIKHIMNGNITNLSSSTHQEIHKIFKDEIVPIVNQVDAKVLENENELLLKAVFSQDIMSIVQKNFVVDTFDLQIELDRMKEKLESCIIKKEKEYATLWNDWYKNRASNTLDHLSQKLEDKNVSLEFQVKNYAKENAHLKTTYKNLFDSINVTRAQTKRITDSLQNKLNDMIYENTKLIAQLFDKASEQKNTTKGVDNTAKTRRPRPRNNTKNDRVYSSSKSSGMKNKEVDVEEHHRNLSMSKNKRHISSECNNIKLAIQNDNSEVIYGICKQCLITANHDVCVLNYVNAMNSRDTKQSANVSNIENKKKQKLNVKKPKKVHSKERLVSPTPSEPSIFRRVYNQRAKKIMETMNVTFDELSTMAFEQRSSKPGLQGMTSRQITMYDDYIGGQPTAAPRTAPAAPAPQVPHTPTTSTTIADSAPKPTNLSSQVRDIPNSSHNVDELEPHPQHAQKQDDQAPI
ncbi:hypothetical protein Tco_1117977 [Tanacetum coccineum]